MADIPAGVTLLGDKGYGSNAIRAAADARNIWPNIPNRLSYDFVVRLGLAGLPGPGGAPRGGAPQPPQALFPLALLPHRISRSRTREL